LHLRNRIVLIALIVLHLAAILWYRVARGRPLTHAMITGDALAPETPSARDDLLVRLSGLALAILCGLAVWALVR
jgi:hypothetical protein